MVSGDEWRRPNYSMMDDLIPLINRLQAVLKTTGLTESRLPQIVVVGDQSTGKSSVLESLVGWGFLPRGTGIVTRCPIILQLTQLKENRDLDSEGLTEWCELELDEEKRKFTDCDKVREAIEKYQVEIAGDGRGVSKTPVIVRVHSKTVVDLTVVDLPGIVKVAVDGQPDDIVEQVHDLIMQYIENPSAIILAVSAANADIATSESIKLAKEVDPDGIRTISVLTKLDLMDEGTDARAVLMGEVLKVKLGIVGVVNRSQRDINDNLSLAEMREKEERFLKKVYPQIQGMGSVYLAQRLNELLKEHIARNMPDLVRRIADLTKECEEELRILGLPLPTKKTESFRLIYDTTCEFIKTFSKLVEDGEQVGERENENPCPFPCWISNKFEWLLTNIELDATEIKNPERLEEELRKTKNIEGYASIEKVFKESVRSYLYKMEKPAVDCATAVERVLVIAAQQCFPDSRLQNLNKRIHGIVEGLIQAQRKKCEEKIKEYIMEQRGMICTTDNEFVNLLNLMTGDENSSDKSSNSGSSVAFPLIRLTKRKPDDADSGVATPVLKNLVVEEPEPMVKHTGDLIFCYLEVAKRELCNYIPKVLYNLLLTQTLGMIKDAVMNDLEGEESRLVSEPGHVTERRRQKQTLLKNLHEANEVIKEIRLTL